MELDTILSQIDRYIGMIGKKKICNILLSHAETLEPYDEKIDTLFEIMEHYCGNVYVARLKQILRSKLLARRIPMSPEIIRTLGTSISFLIAEVMSSTTPLSAIERIIEKISNVEIRGTEISVDSDLRRYSRAIALSEAYISLLEASGAFDIPMLIQEYCKCFIQSAEKLDTEKTIVAFSPIPYSTRLTMDMCSEILRAAGKNINSLFGISIVLGYGLLKHTHSMHSLRYFAWAKFLQAGGFSDEEMLTILEKARGLTHGVIYDIFSGLLKTHYCGSLTGLIDIIGNLPSVENAVELLTSISYAGSGLTGLSDVLRICERLAEKGGNLCSRYVFEILNKIASEARPSILRRLLETKEARSRIINIIENTPSLLVLSAVNRLVKAYLPMSTIVRMSKKRTRSLNHAVLDASIPDWKRVLDKKTLIYLGVADG